jgi:hypothetical protein
MRRRRAITRRNARLSTIEAILGLFAFLKDDAPAES